MATYFFSALLHNQTLSFDPAVDVLVFDRPEWRAASVRFWDSSDGADLLLGVGGKAVRLAGMSPELIASANFTFPGSKLLIGDATSATANDSQANLLTGTSGKDYLDGLGGADTLIGGDGGDVYVVDDPGDQVIETKAGPGQIDTVHSSLTNYTLPDYVENLRLVGTGNLNGTGNRLNNLLQANAGDNVLDGGAGVDTVSYRNVPYQPGFNGGVTADLAAGFATGGSGTDTLIGIENLIGSGYADTLIGDAGNNRLDGGIGGADSLSGGGGDDLLRIPSLSFQSLDGGSGIDTLSLAGSGLRLDMGALDGRLHDLEIIQLNDANTLQLTVAAVRNLSGTSDMLVVEGTAASKVYTDLGWIRGADALANGKTYHTYTQGTATLWLNVALATTGVNSVVPLSSLNGGDGFRLDGTQALDYAGGALGGAGDINGDGFADLIVGVRGADPQDKYSAGSSYVVFGKAQGFAATLELASLDGSGGFRLDGEQRFDYAGVAVSGAGDVNGDGLADLIIGAHHADPNGRYDAGASYVVFGKAGGFPGAFGLGALNGSNGFRLEGANLVEGRDHVGMAVSAAGDINGDGFADVLVGASDADPNGYYSGSAYLVFGKASGFAPTLNLADLNGANGFRLAGLASGDRLGSVSTAGDVNGDGFGDLIVGAREADPHGLDSGSSYVVLGRASGFGAAVNLANLNGNNGFRLDGPEGRQYAGGSVSAAGDINGDGFADLVIGASWASPDGRLGAGSAYVVFGQRTGFAAALNLGDLDGGNGFRLDGGEWTDRAGVSVSGAGDVNGDGYDDLIVGAFGAEPNGSYSGSAYVVFGKAQGFTAAFNLASLTGEQGFRLDGAASGDFSGGLVRAAGDVNGDGFADLMIGASGASVNGKMEAGSGYVLFGGDFSGAVTKLGAAGNDTLTGTAAAERFVGGQGNDNLNGRGGADVFHGGAGNDVIRVSDLGFQRADGGGGIDTLALTGGGLNLNLASFRNQLAGIERINLTGSGDNTLTLLKRDVLNLSDTGNTLRVDGNAGDHYHFSDGGWVQKADVTLVGVTYHAFENGQARLLLDADLTAG